MKFEDFLINELRREYVALGDLYRDADMDYNVNRDGVKLALKRLGGVKYEQYVEQDGRKFWLISHDRLMCKRTIEQVKDWLAALVPEGGEITEEELHKATDRAGIARGKVATARREFGFQIMRPIDFDNCDECDDPEFTILRRPVGYTAPPAPKPQPPKKIKRNKDGSLPGQIPIAWDHPEQAWGETK